MELQVGKVYRAKKPLPAGTMFSQFFNDRQIVWMSLDGQIIQYDGPAVAIGRRLPKVTREKFEKWAEIDVTDTLPKGEWAKWDK